MVVAEYQVRDSQRDLLLFLEVRVSKEGKQEGHWMVDRIHDGIRLDSEVIDRNGDDLLVRHLLDQEEILTDIEAVPLEFQLTQHHVAQLGDIQQRSAALAVQQIQDTDCQEIRFLTKEDSALSLNHERGQVRGGDVVAARQPF